MFFPMAGYGWLCAVPPPPNITARKNSPKEVGSRGPPFCPCGWAVWTEWRFRPLTLPPGERGSWNVGKIVLFWGYPLFLHVKNAFYAF